jgi:hypothetical protein
VIWKIAKNLFGSMCTSLEHMEYNFLHFSSTKSDAKQINKAKSKHCHKIIYFEQVAIQ